MFSTQFGRQLFVRFQYGHIKLTYIWMHYTYLRYLISIVYNFIINGILKMYGKEWLRWNNLLLTFSYI